MDELDYTLLQSATDDLHVALERARVMYRYRQITKPLSTAGIELAAFFQEVSAEYASYLDLSHTLREEVLDYRAGLGDGEGLILARIDLLSTIQDDDTKVHAEGHTGYSGKLSYAKKLIAASFELPKYSAQNSRPPLSEHQFRDYHASTAYKDLCEFVRDRLDSLLMIRDRYPAVIDWGCGSGDLVSQLYAYKGRIRRTLHNARKSNVRYLGIDIDPYSLLQTNMLIERILQVNDHLSDASIEVIDARSATFQDRCEALYGKGCVVVFSNSLHLLTPVALYQALRHAICCTTNGGRLVVSDVLIPSWNQTGYFVYMLSKELYSVVSPFFSSAGRGWGSSTNGIPSEYEYFVGYVDNEYNDVIRLQALINRDLGNSLYEMYATIEKRLNDRYIDYARSMSTSNSYESERNAWLLELTERQLANLHSQRTEIEHLLTMTIEGQYGL